MGALAVGIGVATVAWFLAAAVSFFNPVVDKIYRSEEEHPAVRKLPKGPKTIGMILGAVFVQCVLWAGVFRFIRPVLGPDNVRAMILFGLVIAVMKIVPRDADRLLLTTYPKKRMIIELVIGIVMGFVVAAAFAWTIPYTHPAS